MSTCNAARPQAVYVVKPPTSGGFVAGLFGCLFGILGIFFIGLVFVPLAFLCGAIGLVR